MKRMLWAIGEMLVALLIALAACAAVVGVIAYIGSIGYIHGYRDAKKEVSTKYQQEAMEREYGELDSLTGEWVWK